VLYVSGGRAEALEEGRVSLGLYKKDSGKEAPAG